MIRFIYDTVLKGIKKEELLEDKEKLKKWLFKPQSETGGRCS